MYHLNPTSRIEYDIFFILMVQVCLKGFYLFSWINFRPDNFKQKLKFVIQAGRIEVNDVRRYSLYGKEKRGVSFARNTPFFYKNDEVLDDDHIGCGRSFRTFFDFERNPITFVERPESSGVDGCMMYENIRAVFLFDKTKSLTVVKPLHNTICHSNFLLRVKKK